MRIAVFASGNGSNFEAVTKATRSGEIHGDIALLLTDKKTAFALERAKTLGVPTLTLRPKDFQTLEDYEGALLEALRRERIDLIVLAGYMRILSPALVAAYRGKILNIHPSLLPKYPGKDVIGRVFAAGERETGVTVHFVDEGVDSGEIILQETIAIDPSWGLSDLEAAVHKVEHSIYPKAIEKVLKGSTL